MKTRLLAFALGVVSLVAAAPSMADDTPPQEKPAETKILLIGHKPDHPHGSHMYMQTCEMLAACVRLTDGVTATVSDGWPTDPAVLEGVDAIVLYTSPGAELLLDGPQREDVARLMKEGVGLVTIHWATAVRRENFERLGATWLEFLGGTWISNDGLTTETSKLTQLDPEHPICRGWSEYDLHDEYYLSATIETAKPLLQVSTIRVDAVVGWTYERPDGGRSFATTLGHFYKNFQIEAFRRAIVNGILWAAHVEVPKDGAPVNISEDLLALPPEPK